MESGTGHFLIINNYFGQRVLSQLISFVPFLNYTVTRLCEQIQTNKDGMGPRGRHNLSPPGRMMVYDTGLKMDFFCMHENSLNFVDLRKCRR